MFARSRAASAAAHSSLLLAASLIGGFGAMAQSAAHSSQVLQLPSVAEVHALWKMPPAEYGPEPYYGLNGPVTLEVVRRDLDTMRALGFRAVTAQFGYGSSMAYLSPEYLQFFRAFVLEAKRRDMRVWIVDDAGYPSGFAGGKFSSEHPELRMQALVTTQRTTMSAGTPFQLAAGPNVVSVTAIRDGSGASVPIPIVQGEAHWTAPEGTWTVYVVEHAFRTSPTRSDTNPKRVKDDSQSLEDYLDPAATAQYLHFTHEAYKRAMGDEFGKTILGFRGDEPDYSIAGLPWTPKFFTSFEQHKGYDIRPFLAAFLQAKEVHLTAEQLRAKADFYDVFADLFRDGFFKPQADWCAANGMEYQVHLNHEEQQIALARSEGDFFRDMKYVQVPAIDSIWHQIWTDTISDFPRLASSAAHVYGHPRTLTESFAAYRPTPDLAMARYILNEQFVRGVNLVETMYFPATSTPARGGPAPFMRDPGYPELMHYTSRMSYLLSMGRPAAEVALLLPSESLWMGETKADDTFVSMERLLSEHQIDFDVVGEDAIGSEMNTEAGAFVSASGNRYRTVFMPPADLLPSAVVERLRMFAKGGGRLLFLGKTPSLIAVGNNLHARTANGKDFAWAKVVQADLPPTPTPPAQPPTNAPAPLQVPAELMVAVMNAVPPQSFIAREPSTGLRVAHRKLRDGEVFLLFNESATAFTNDVTLRAPGHVVELWNATTGEIQAVRGVGRKSGQVSVPVALAPYETRLLVVRQ